MKKLQITFNFAKNTFIFNKKYIYNNKIENRFLTIYNIHMYFYQSKIQQILKNTYQLYKNTYRKKNCS